MAYYRFQGIVIKRINVGESDKLVTVFTHELGKITLKAKGIRRLTSKRAGSLELFSQVSGSAVTGRGPIDTLTEVQLLDSHSSWKKHLGRITVAYELCETLDKLTAEHQPHPELFLLFCEKLKHISGLGRNWRSQVDAWLTQFLIVLGFWPANHPVTGDIHTYISS
ncbi:MAG: recO, partial [Bacteroidetes bacterium]|nr:recO [Bacteroidota bacterium]